MITKLGLIQHSCSDDIKENFEKAVSMIEEAGKKGANIVATQELFKTRYFCQVENWDYFDFAEEINESNETIKTLSKLASSFNMVILASLFEKRAKGVFHNTLVVIGNRGDLLGIYRKMHIPDDPHFYEKFYFRPGDLGYRVFDTPFGKVGTLICWDQWFPEAARLTAMKGADIIFYPTAIGWLPEEKEEFGDSQINAWKTIQQSHAVANGCFVASINRVGYEGSPDGNGGIEFWGNSFVANTYGEILKEASQNKDEILIVDINLKEIEETRRFWPFFRDRRTDTYGDLSKVWID